MHTHRLTRAELQIDFNGFLMLKVAEWKPPPPSYYFLSTVAIGHIARFPSRTRLHLVIRGFGLDRYSALFIGTLYAR